MNDLAVTKTTTTVKPVGPDFCLVQLTAAGLALAGKNPLRYSNGRQQFIFIPGGDPVKVARYEWDLALAGHTTRDGKTLFEIVPNPVANTTDAQSTAEEKK